MNFSIITSIHSRLRKKRQLIIIGLANKEFVFLNANQIKQNTGLEIFEIELLIGSSLRVDFYSIGEKMLNSKLCSKENLIVKEYFFELQKPVEKLRIENKDFLLPFKRISEIFYFTKFSRDNVGIKTADGGRIFISERRFESQSNLSKDEQHILVGSYIYPTYYKKGDLLKDGSPIIRDNVLKWLNVRYVNNIDGMHENFESSVGYYNGIEDNDGATSWGYESWDDMALHTAYEGDPDNLWNTD